MTKEVEARVKIFQRAMVACHSSNPTDCVEWFADRIVELEKENADLKNKLEHRNCLDCSNHSSKLRMRNLELEKENAELKDKAEMYDFFYEGNGFKRRGLNNSIQIAEYIKKLELRLSYAKEIIKKFSEFVNNENEYDPEHPQEHTDLWNKLCAETEQFLNCSEKPNN